MYTHNVHRTCSHPSSLPFFADPPVVIRPSLSSVPQTGDTITLQCSLSLSVSHRVTYEWRKNGVLLTTITKSTSDTVTGELSIEDIQESDAGFYECTAVYSVPGNDAELSEDIGAVSVTVDGECSRPDGSGLERAKYGSSSVLEHVNKNLHHRSIHCIDRTHQQLFKNVMNPSNTYNHSRDM